MTDLSKATPRPSKLHPDGYSIIQEDVGGKLIERVSQEDCEANAALIVRAVNCHDELLAALRDLIPCAAASVGEIPDPMPTIHTTKSAINVARAALAKADAP